VKSVDAVWTRDWKSQMEGTNFKFENICPYVFLSRVFIQTPAMSKGDEEWGRKKPPLVLK
jgi:hypothetical protein